MREKVGGNNFAAPVAVAVAEVIADVAGVVVPLAAVVGGMEDGAVAVKVSAGVVVDV